MQKAYQGVSFALAKELCMRAHVPPDDAADTLGSHLWEQLYAEWQSWLAACESGSFNITKDGLRRLSVLGSFDQPCPSVHEAVHEQYYVAQAEERFSQLRAAVKKALASAVAKLQGRLSAFQKQLRSADDAEATQKLADLVMANVYCWPKGSLEMKVEDWETGVSLQPECMSVVSHMQLPRRCPPPCTPSGQLHSGGR